MLQDNTTLKTTAPTEFHDMAEQLSALRDDMSKLTQSFTSVAERRGRKIASDISDGVGEAARYVERKGRASEAELERSVAAHPMLAIGLAVGAGLLIGALTRR